MKRSHVESAAASSVVYPPHVSLGAKQASWTEDSRRGLGIGYAGSTSGVTAATGPGIMNPRFAAPPATLAARNPSVGILTRTSSSADRIPGALTQEVLCRGFLSKRGHFFKAWLPRYFVLTKNSLRYYRKNPTSFLCGDKKHAADAEKRLLKGEILRANAIRVDATEMFKGRPYALVLSVRKTSRGFASMLPSHREQAVDAPKKTGTELEGPVVMYYMEAATEPERQRWLQALQRWIEYGQPAKLGRAIFEYVVNNEYSSYRYEQKRNDLFEPPIAPLSPAAEAGRRLEAEHPVLVNLIREMHDCQQEDDLVFILDQILGEVKEGVSSGYVKKLVASAGEVKLETSPLLWTQPVKAAYGQIMQVLYAQSISSGNWRGTLQPRLVEPSRKASDDSSDSSSDCTFHRSYKLGRKLGSGAFSVVHIATHRETRKQVAVKCIAKSGLNQNDVASLKHEVEIMSKLNHPNLVPLLDYFEEDRYYYIVTPLCTGGELFDDLIKRKTYTEDDARVLMRKLASAIMYIHSRGIVHRDLKPENILLKTSAPGAEVMIADFGFARSMQGEKRLTACGTPGYIAPEVICGQAYGAEVDCWSLGVILYIFLCGYPPFRGENHAIIFEQIVNGNYKFESPAWDCVSAEAKDLVCKLLTVDRTKRLTAAGVLEHVWMRPGKVVLYEEEAEIPTRMVRVESDLLSALSEMRKQSLTHDIPKIRPSDMNVDLLELSSSSIENDVQMLDRELATLEF